MNNKTDKKMVIFIVIIMLITININTIVASASSKTTILITNSKYNTATACWDFSIKSSTKNKIYYSLEENKILDSKCNYIVSGQVISVLSNLIKSSHKTLRLFTLDKNNNITYNVAYDVNILARNEYMKDLINMNESIYNQNDIQYIKAKKLYTWIGKNKIYNYDSYTNDEYGAFYGKSSACSGFASLYVDMCRIARIKCEYTNDDESGYNYKEWHAWNHIYLDEKTYLVDVTWSGVCFDNKIDYSHFCNNSIVNHVITEKYDLSSSIYDNYEIETVQK